jgi:Arc/MetJ-type ribon-helix-helix transcriptional regulator
MMKKYNVSISEEIDKRLEQERKKRGFETIPETIRVILSEWYQAKS